MADIDNHVGEETGPKEDATPEQARKVLADLKDGTDTLYMGNICKTWTREQVLERLKNLGVEQIEEIYLPDNPNKEGKSIGYALLEFKTHSDAMSRISRLNNRDALFGRDRSAKVAFSQSIHPSEEALLQAYDIRRFLLFGEIAFLATFMFDQALNILSCYVLSSYCGIDKLKKLCEQYGEDEKVQLSRKFLSTRRKDFGFVSFVTRESAVACVEGINKAEIGEGDNKGRIGKKAAKGGYKVRMDGQKTVVEASKMEGNNISKRPQEKGKGVANKQNYRWNKSHYPGSSGKQNDKGEIHEVGLVIRRDERMSLGSYLHVRNTWWSPLEHTTAFRWGERMNSRSYLHDSLSKLDK
ncbi:hypothetical protein Syun_016115 [Stephania yunnanensis]|uniref:RRM domain-containing protein n=1 Tax=Stephania yunnanensis TaxID=152371 RepID=A0AAP0J4K3_9MAGN